MKINKYKWRSEKKFYPKSMTVWKIKKFISVSIGGTCRYVYVLFTIQRDLPDSIYLHAHDNSLPLYKIILFCFVSFLRCLYHEHKENKTWTERKGITNSTINLSDHQSCFLLAKSDLVWPVFVQTYFWDVLMSVRSTW